MAGHFEGARKVTVMCMHRWRLRWSKWWSGCRSRRVYQRKRCSSWLLWYMTYKSYKWPWKLLQHGFVSLIPDCRMSQVFLKAQAQISNPNGSCLALQQLCPIALKRYNARSYEVHENPAQWNAFLQLILLGFNPNTVHVMLSYHCTDWSSCNVATILSMARNCQGQLTLYRKGLWSYRLSSGE